MFATNLLHLLTPYEIRRGILQHLSAWDIAKLDLVLGHMLDRQEREIYLKPARDLFHDLQEMQFLIAAGMKIVLLGNDVPFLHQRLEDPIRYMKHTSPKKRLRIYLLSVFPILLKNEQLLDRMLGFCMSQYPDPARLRHDKAVFQDIQKQNADQRMFMMSFGVAIQGGRMENRGFWHPTLEARDAFVDLRVYVPCLRDRLLGEAIVQPSELPRISGHVTRPRMFWTIWVFIRVCIQRFTLESAICPERFEGSQLTVRFFLTKSVVGIV